MSHSEVDEPVAVNPRRNAYPLPSFDLEEIWDWLGNNGVNSQSADHLASCFDVLAHQDGVLYSRMKHVKDREPVPPRDDRETAIFFKGTVFHDQMGALMSRKESKDEVMVIHTHDDETKEAHDVIEISHLITFDQYEAEMAKLPPLEQMRNERDAALLKVTQVEAQLAALLNPPMAMTLMHEQHLFDEYC